MFPADTVADQYPCTFADLRRTEADLSAPEDDAGRGFIRKRLLDFVG